MHLKYPNSLYYRSVRILYLKLVGIIQNMIILIGTTNQLELEQKYPNHPRRLVEFKRTFRQVSEMPYEVMWNSVNKLLGRVV